MIANLKHEWLDENWGLLKKGGGLGKKIEVTLPPRHMLKYQPTLNVNHPPPSSLLSSTTSYILYKWTKVCHCWRLLKYPPMLTKLYSFYNQDLAYLVQVFLDVCDASILERWSYWISMCTNVHKIPRLRHNLQVIKINVKNYYRGHLSKVNHCTLPCIIETF